MVFYLKVNRDCNYTFHNMQHWIEVLKVYNDSKLFVICDSQELKNKLKSKFDLAEDQFMESIKDKRNENIVRNTCVKRWFNAGYAHLTTFSHADNNGIEKFWNIDADDTCICLSAGRCVEMMKKVEEYSAKYNISIMSLDMWRTLVSQVYGEIHWTFGITYTDNTIDWYEIMEHYCDDKDIEELKLIPNIDKFFTFLAIKSGYKIESFYCENMRFIHYSDDLVSKFEKSGLYHWKKGKLIFPILLFFFNAKKRGRLKIPKEVINININITDKETKEFLSEWSEDTLNLEK